MRVTDTSRLMQPGWTETQPPCPQGWLPSLSATQPSITYIPTAQPRGALPDSLMHTHFQVQKTQNKGFPKKQEELCCQLVPAAAADPLDAAPKAETGGGVGGVMSASGALEGRAGTGFKAF